MSEKKTAKLCKWADYIVCRASDYTYNLCEKSMFETCNLRAVNPEIQKVTLKELEVPPTTYTVIESVDLRKTKNWWVALLLVRPSRQKVPKAFIRLVKYRKYNPEDAMISQWKLRSSFNITRVEDWQKIKDIIDNMLIPVWEKWNEEHKYATDEEIEDKRDDSDTEGV